MNWSGSSLRGKGSTSVDGRYKVPFISADVINTSFNSRYSAWVGIDGDNGSTDVVQNGLHCWVELVDPINGLGRLNAYLWWEWFPENEVAITNIPVSEGDEVATSVTIDDPTHALMYVENISSGKYSNFTVTAPSGTSASLTSAEWIVERPGIGGSLSTLLDYGEIQISGMANLFDVGNGVNIDMENESGKIISRSSFPNVSTVDCTYQLAPLQNKKS